MNLPSGDVRVHEDARADDAAHDDHRRVEQAQPPRELDGRARLAVLSVRIHQWSSLVTRRKIFLKRPKISTSRAGQGLFILKTRNHEGTRNDTKKGQLLS